MITGLIVGMFGALVAGLINGILGLPVWLGAVAGGVIVFVSSVIFRAAGFP